MQTAFKPGDPWPDWRWWEELTAAARRNRLADVGAGLEAGPGWMGQARTPKIWAVLSGSGNPYAFAERVPSGTAGGWAPAPGGRSGGPGTGFPGAYEINGAAGLAGTVQRLTFTTANDWRFRDARAGSAGGAGPPMIILQSCFCPVPASLRMTSADPNCNYRMFQSCTLTYRLPPPEFAPLNITGPCFLSTETFFDPISNSYFYYHFFCLYNQYLLTRLYPTSPYGSPFRDATLYTWLVGGYGNVCDPFYLHNGVPYPGSDATCRVTIDPA